MLGLAAIISVFVDIGVSSVYAQQPFRPGLPPFLRPGINDCPLTQSSQESSNTSKSCFFESTNRTMNGNVTGNMSNTSNLARLP